MQKHKEHAQLFKAFADEKRLKILELLTAGEACACVLLKKLDLTQSGLSYHMKILTESEVIMARQEGKWTYYQISEEGRQNAAQLLLDITNKQQ